MKTFVLFLVVLVSSSAFAWPNLRELQDEDKSDKEFDQALGQCGDYLKCEEVEEGQGKRQEEDEENKAACTRLIDEAEKELLEEDKKESESDDEKDEKERAELMTKLEECKNEIDIDCNKGTRDTRFLRQMLRNREANDCLEAVKKARKLRKGDGKCKCEGKGRDGDGKGRHDEGKGSPTKDQDGKGREENKEDLEKEVKRLLRLLEKK